MRRILFVILSKRIHQKKYIQWKHQEFLDISKRGECNFERVEEITKILS